MFKEEMPKWFYNLIKARNAFLFLSFTWGLIMTLVGCVVTIPLLIYFVVTNNSYRVEERGHCVYLIFGEGWGGFNLGPFCFVSKTAKIRTYAHEHGHSLQNCLYGPFSVIFSLCSMIRYHYRNFREKINKPCTTKYDDFWFEGQASNWGNELFNNALREE